MSKRKPTQDKFRPRSDVTVAAAMGYQSLAAVPSEYAWTEPRQCFSRLAEADLRDGDDLLSDPGCPMQSVKAFQKSKDLRTPTLKQRTIYLVGLGDMEMLPFLMASIAAYLQAFYMGMQVKIMEDFRIVPWHEAKRARTASATRASFVGLQSESAVGRVRSRQAPDRHKLQQLNVCDVTDMLIEEMKALPNAYCVLGITPYDMYETEKDLFIAGRAFGGNGCAVVSCARYSTNFPLTGPEWSYGDVHAEGAARIAAGEPGARTAASHSSDDQTWLARVCKTASHELGHCFGLDHCTAFHCIMQGAASIEEDFRQPPFLCPLEHVKLRCLLEWSREDIVKRYDALLTVLKSEGFYETSFSASFSRWIMQRKHEIGSCEACEITYDSSRP